MERKDYPYVLINCAVHMFFLVESLLLKNLAPALKPRVQTKNLHLFIEEFRPWCTREALSTAEALIRKDPGSFEALKKLNEAALIRLGEKAENQIKPEDIEHIHDLLLMLAESGSYLRWGEGREFI